MVTDSKVPKLLIDRVIWVLNGSFIWANKFLNFSERFLLLVSVLCFAIKKA